MSTKSNTNTSTAPPFEVRSLVKYEIADGCPVIDDKIPFTIPLKGMEYVTPSLKNVFNKFSVRYFIKMGVATDNNCVWSKPFELIFYK